MPTPQDQSSSVATYDLVLLLDTEAEQGARAGVLKDVKASISSDGKLVRHDEWGRRELAYPIRHREQAEYHLLQFHPAHAELLRGLDRSLRIADEVLRFRIVKLRPGTPEPPEMRSAHPPAEHTASRDAGAPPPRAPSAPAAEAASAAETPAATDDAAPSEATGATEDAPPGPDEQTPPAEGAADAAPEGAAAGESA